MSSATDDAAFQEIVKSLDPGYGTQGVDRASSYVASPNWERTIGQYRSTRVGKKPGTNWFFYAQQLEERPVHPHLRLVEDLPFHLNHDAEATPQRASRRSGFSIFYRSLWLVLGVVGVVWGLVVGMTLAGANIVGPATAAAGTVIAVGLMVTLVVAGRRTQIDE